MAVVLGAYMLWWLSVVAQTTLNSRLNHLHDAEVVCRRPAAVVEGS